MVTSSYRPVELNWKRGRLLIGRHFFLVTTLLVGLSSREPCAGQPAAPLRADELAARMDRIILAKLAAAKVEPAPVSDDAEFLRRVSLDIAGRIPGAFEVRD